MAMQSVPTAAADDFAALWPPINQLESILELMNEDLCSLATETDPGRRTYLGNRAHTMLGAAQTIASGLAESVAVR